MRCACPWLSDAAGQQAAAKPNSLMARPVATSSEAMRVDAVAIDLDDAADSAPTPPSASLAARPVAPAATPPTRGSGVTLNLGSVAQQLMLVSKAKSNFKRLKPLKGKLLQGGFPGAPIHASIQLDAATLAQLQEGASLYERVR